jgi:hypothetical protein
MEQLPPDWKEFLSLLVSHRVRFLVVGAHALAVHGRPRLTGDLDVWVDATPANARRVLAALAEFGFGSVGLGEADFTRPGMVIALGNPPLRVDVLTSISGVSFERAWRGRVRHRLSGVTVGVLGRREYRANKRAAGRPKDLLDLELLDETEPKTRTRG